MCCICVAHFDSLPIHAILEKDNDSHLSVYILTQT